jgi:hypothetical protein
VSNEPGACRASDYINMQCPGREQPYMLFPWTLDPGRSAAAAL